MAGLPKWTCVFWQEIEGVDGVADLHDHDALVENELGTCVSWQEKLLVMWYEEVFDHGALLNLEAYYRCGD